LLSRRISALEQFTDDFGEGFAPGTRGDAERLADLGAIEHRIEWSARRGRVVGRRDRLDRGRRAPPGRRLGKDRLGESVPSRRAGAAEMVGTPTGGPGPDLPDEFMAR